MIRHQNCKKTGKNSGKMGRQNSENVIMVLLMLQQHLAPKI